MTVKMRMLGGVTLLAALVAMTQVAPAANFKVQGTYGMISYKICQTAFSTTKNSGGALTSLSSMWTAAGGSAGMMSVDVGTVIFPSTATSSGNVTYSTVEVLGHTARMLSTGVPTDASPITRNPPQTGTSTFSFTDTTATLGTQVYDISVGEVALGVARIINLVPRPNSDEACISAVTMTRQ